MVPEAPVNTLVIMKQHRDNYFPPYRVAKELDIGVYLLSQITSSFLVMPGRRDIGMCMKYDKRNLQLPGYTRRRTDGVFCVCV